MDAPVFCLAPYGHRLWYPVSPCWNYESPAFLCSGFPSPWLFHLLHCPATQGTPDHCWSLSFILWCLHTEFKERWLIPGEVSEDKNSNEWLLGACQLICWPSIPVDSIFKEWTIQRSQSAGKIAYEIYVQTFLVIISETRKSNNDWIAFTLLFMTFGVLLYIGENNVYFAYTYYYPIVFKRLEHPWIL